MCILTSSWIMKMWRWSTVLHFRFHQAAGRNYRRPLATSIQPAHALEKCLKSCTHFKDWYAVHPLRLSRLKCILYKTDIHQKCTCTGMSQCHNILSMCINLLMHMWQRLKHNAIHRRQKGKTNTHKFAAPHGAVYKSLLMLTWLCMFMTAFHIICVSLLCSLQ